MLKDKGCIQCGRPIPGCRRRSGRRRFFCSNRCRQRAYRDRQPQLWSQFFDGFATDNKNLRAFEPAAAGVHQVEEDFDHG